MLDLTGAPETSSGRRTGTRSSTSRQAETRSRNAAVGAAVLTEGESMEVSICDVVLSSPVPRHLAPKLTADDA